MRHVVIHGHFYQPPREEPWLELVPRELTAAPEHDWNSRITRECYAPLARARVFDAEGKLRRVLNAYASCSFNVGATLFNWFDTQAPAVAVALKAGDAASRARLGYGNAIAMPYHHLIMPLASRRDKITEVRWGIRDFRARFGRDPDGMWLPETAVDSETLDVLAVEGIRFTILSPHQVTVAPIAGRPGRWHGAAGRNLAIFCYDGTLTHAVAFGDALTAAERLEQRLDDAPMAANDGPTITSLATDGETFGHHHRHGDLALASLIDRLEGREHIELTNYSALLAAYPPDEDVTLVENTSWSCSHGIGRWRNDCGCRMDPATSQAWRAPLRAGLEALAQGIREVSATNWPSEAGDLWEVRDAAGPDLAGAMHLPAAARQQLEAERHALAMFTSCGWFFDDLARLEPRIVLRHAARALDFVPQPVREPLEKALLSALALAHSNDPTKGDGVAIWHRDVLAEADGPVRLAAGLAALRDLAPDLIDQLVLTSHTWLLDGDDIITQHRTTGRETRWRAESVTLGVVPIHIRIRSPDAPHAEDRTIPIGSYPEPVRSLLLQVARPMVFEAALSGPERTLMHDGLLEPAVARRCAFAGAWALVARDGVDDAGIVVHAVLDLFDLDDVPMPDDLRVDAFERLAPLPVSPMRDSLADRLALRFPTSV